MKKVSTIAILLAIMLVVCCMFTACNQSSNITNDTDSGTNDSTTNSPTQEDNNNAQVDESTPEQTQPDSENNMKTISITIGNTQITATLYDNQTAEAFAKLLPMTITMQDMPHEKYYYLPQQLPTNVELVKYIEAGDIMLWGNSCLVLFYESFSTSYSYTKIGKIIDTDKLSVLSNQNSTKVTIELVSDK